MGEERREKRGGGTRLLRKKDRKPERMGERLESRNKIKKGKHFSLSWPRGYASVFIETVGCGKTARGDDKCHMQTQQETRSRVRDPNCGTSIEFKTFCLDPLLFNNAGINFGLCQCRM